MKVTKVSNNPSGAGDPIIKKYEVNEKQIEELRKNMKHEWLFSVNLSLKRKVFSFDKSIMPTIFFCK